MALGHHTQRVIISGDQLGSRSMKLLIRNGRIIDPATQTDRVADLLVSDGTIVSIAPNIPTPSDGVILEVQRRLVCPGFIDLHCHLREPGFEDKETIATGTLAAARGGFTIICCMPNTNPPISTPDTIRQVGEIARREGIVRVLPIASVTEARGGRRLANLDALAEAGAVAFSDDGDPVTDSDIMRQALERSVSLGLPIIDHCEDPILFEGAAIHSGTVAARLGTKGIPPLAEERMVSRDIDLARQTGGRLHIAHVSTAGSVAQIRQAKTDGINITSEVTPHHLTITDEAVLRSGTNAKVNPPLRSREHLDALLDGLIDGTIDAIATDHAPHTEADKAGDLETAAFGISGFETALGSLMALVHLRKISLSLLISKLTSEPARVIGISPEAGTLRTGAPADIAIIDPDAEWRVEPEHFASKGKNTPLAGMLFKGKVIATICGGHIVHREM